MLFDKDIDIQYDTKQSAILLDPLKIDFRVPFAITNGVIFDKANDSYREKLRELYRSNNTFHGPSIEYENLIGKIYEGILYAADLNHKEENDNKETQPSMIGAPLELPKGHEKKFVPLSDCEWEYWHIYIDENNLSFEDVTMLMSALLLSEANLSVGYISSGRHTYMVYLDPKRFYKDYPMRLIYKKGKANPKDYRKKLSKWQLKHVTKILNLQREFDFENYTFVAKAIFEYHNVLQLPADSSLNIIGLFSILELLLAHDVRKSEATRISWQLSKKIPLLNHRFEIPVNFSEHFKCDSNVKEETIIERLYLKRSLIAHGNQNLEKLEPKLEIISRGDEIAFLKLLIRRIITLALEEPRLIADLKEC